MCAKAVAWLLTRRLSLGRLSQHAWMCVCVCRRCSREWVSVAYALKSLSARCNAIRIVLPLYCIIYLDKIYDLAFVCLGMHWMRNVWRSFRVGFTRMWNACDVKQSDERHTDRFIRALVHSSSPSHRTHPKMDTKGKLSKKAKKNLSLPFFLFISPLKSFWQTICSRMEKVPENSFTMLSPVLACVCEQRSRNKSRVCFAWSIYGKTFSISHLP